jgi:hypothetical protein
MAAVACYWRPHATPPRQDRGQDQHRRKPEAEPAACGLLVYRSILAVRTGVVEPVAGGVVGQSKSEISEIARD